MSQLYGLQNKEQFRNYYSLVIASFLLRPTQFEVIITTNTTFQQQQRKLAEMGQITMHFYLLNMIQYYKGNLGDNMFLSMLPFLPRVS